MTAAIEASVGAVICLSTDKAAVSYTHLLDTAQDIISRLRNRQPSHPDCPDYLFSILLGDKKREDESAYREYQSALRRFNNYKIASIYLKYIITKDKIKVITNKIVRNVLYNKK